MAERGRACHEGEGETGACSTDCICTNDSSSSVWRCMMAMICAVSALSLSRSCKSAVAYLFREDRIRSVAVCTLRSAILDSSMTKSFLVFRWRFRTLVRRPSGERAAQLGSRVGDEGIASSENKNKRAHQK